VLCFTDVGGIHLEAGDSIESHAAASYRERKASIAAADMLDKFTFVDVPEQQSFSSKLTAEEIIKCASETAALKQLSGSLLLSSGSESVGSSEIPHRDNQIDGAEDSASERSEADHGTVLTESDAELKGAAESSSSSVATSVIQKTVAVAALPLGVYITKPSPATDSKASTAPGSDDANCDIAMSDRDRRRLQINKQFPILHDLGQRP